MKRTKFSKPSTTSHKEKEIENCQLLALETFSSDSFLSINKRLLSTFGPNTTIFLGNLVDKYKYFIEKDKLQEDGSFFLTHADQEIQTGMSEYEIRKCKKLLIKEKILSTYMSGVPAKEFYLLNIDNLVDNYLRAIPLKFKGLRVKNLKGYIKDNKFKNNKNKKIYKKDFSFDKNINHLPVKERNKLYIPFVNYLVKIITTSRNVKITKSQATKWCPYFRQLYEDDGIDIARIKKVLVWYKDHIGDPFVPVVQCGASFRKKFLRVEAAIERSKNDGVKSGSRKYGEEINYDDDEIIIKG